MKALIYLLLLVLAGAATASASDDPATVFPEEAGVEVERILAQPVLSLADLFRVADLASPDLAVARIEVQVRAGRRQQAGLFANPELSFEVEEVSVDDPSFNKRKVALSQDLALGGRRGAAVNAARAEADQARELASRERRQVMGRTHKWWIDQIHFREAETAYAEMMAAADMTLSIARTRFESKAAPEAHVTRALLEVYDLQVARQDFERNRVRSNAEMKVLFGGVEVPVDRLTGNLDPPAEGSARSPDLRAEMSEHPTLRAARHGVSAAEAALVTAKKERIPDLNFFVAYGRVNPTDENFVEGGISFPLPLFNRNQGQIAENMSQVAAARYAERRAAHELEAALATTRLTYDTAFQQLAQLEGTLAPAAERALTHAHEAYRVGRLMFLELVDAQRTYNKVLMRTMDLRRGLAIAEVDLMSLLGTGPYADIGVE